MSKPSLPNLRHLNIALHIGANYGFSAASKAVNLSPSAITQAMRGLENQLGVEIFDRSPNGAQPNEMGRVYLDRIALAFEALSRAEAALDADRKTAAIKARLSVSQLRAFVMVCQSGSYSLAARRLGLSQPSVYKAARSVETTFNRRLFQPSSFGVDPSVKAKEFARHVSLALSEIERAHEEVQELRGKMEGRLAIGTLPLIRTSVLPKAVTALLSDFPQVRVQIIDGIYGDLLDSLRHGDLDVICGALRNPLPSRDVEQTSLFKDRLSILVRNGHPILQQSAPSIDQLASLDWIVPRHGTPTRSYFEQLFQTNETGRVPRIIECSSLVAIRAMLMTSERATILSSHQAGYEIEKGDIAIVNAELQGSNRPIGVTTRLNWRPTGVQREFLKRLKQETLRL